MANTAHLATSVGERVWVALGDQKPQMNIYGQRPRFIASHQSLPGTLNANS